MTSLIALVWVNTVALGQYEPLAADRGADAQAFAHRRLGVTGSLLYITAHPDDENNALLVKLRQGFGMRTGLLTLTRGEGGQNEIGPELGEAMGVLRTEEMMVVHRYDGAQQFFSRAYEFGYSFSVEETYEKWGEKETLGDIVRVLRLFRPDIVVTMMPTGAGGGQHHQASARLSMRAVRAAADAREFPEQVASGLQPFKVRKVYHAPFVRGGGAAGEGAVFIETGDYDDRLGMSYAEYGAIARNSHRCQGMNASPVPGRQRAFLIPAKETAPGEVLDGVPMGYERLLDWGEDPAKIPAVWRNDVDVLSKAKRREGPLGAIRGRRDVGKLLNAMTAVRRLRALVPKLETTAAVRADLDVILADEEADLLTIHERRHKFFVSATVVPPRDGVGSGRGGAVDGKLTPGEVAEVEVAICSRAALPVEIHGVGIETPAGWQVTSIGKQWPAIDRDELRKWRFRVEVPKDAKPTQPHWFRPGPDTYRHAIRVSPNEALRAFPAPVLRVRIDYGPKFAKLTMGRPVIHRWYDPAVAKRRAFAVKVVPGINVRVEPELAVFPLDSKHGTIVRVLVENLFPKDMRAHARLVVPELWRVEPPSQEVAFTRENEQKTVEFRVVPPAKLTPGDAVLRAVVEADGREYREGYRAIAYHHIETRHLYREATTTIRSFDVSVPPSLRVGYVMGVGDDVPGCLEQLGATVELLDAAALATGDLSRYDSIVLGIRAYKDREDLIANNQRLLDYVADGGVLVTQYNKYEWNRARYGPYPTRIARPHDRVTDEDAKIKILAPERPLFRTPNKIRESDWDGWVQERGLYFLREWDTRCVPLISVEDSFPYNRGEKRGALVVAQHGEGLWIYTGLGFFRQLPAGVPGAYRLFANLISAGARR